MNWGASYWANDLYGRLYCQVWRKREASDRELVWAARLSTLGILLIAGVILGQLGSIESAWKASLLLGAGMGLPLVLRWVWWRMSAAAELAAIAACLVIAPVLASSTWGEGARLLVMAGCSAAIVVVVSIWGARERPEALERFYAAVRPPGFWGPVAQACGEDASEPARRLFRGLSSTAVMALSTFCVLVGAATFLFGSPAPKWFPWTGGWISLLIAGGAFGVAATWRASRRE
jgi:hypothetical protein